MSEILKGIGLLFILVGALMLATYGMVAFGGMP